MFSVQFWKYESLPGTNHFNPKPLAPLFFSNCLLHSHCCLETLLSHCSIDMVLTLRLLIILRSPLRHLSVFKFNICPWWRVHIHFTEGSCLLQFILTTFSSSVTPIHSLFLGRNFPVIKHHTIFLLFSLFVCLDN